MIRAERCPQITEMEKKMVVRKAASIGPEASAAFRE
jgi:hypothetical protein